jgi:hypothetical protein
MSARRSAANFAAASSIVLVAPSLHLSGGDVTEYSLLLLDPFVSCFTLPNLVPTLRKGRGNYGRVK